MAGTVSGHIIQSSTLAVAVPAGTNVITPYTVNVNPTSDLTYSAGTAANQANKVATPSGTASASAASIDMSSVACVDGQTGFSHWREIIVFNNDTTNTLAWDFTAANANVAMFGAGGATAKVTIQPGTFQRFSKPLGTNGYTVDSTHKIISLDPGANTIAYQVVIVGD